MYLVLLRPRIVLRHGQVAAGEAYLLGLWMWLTCWDYGCGLPVGLVVVAYLLGLWLPVGLVIMAYLLGLWMRIIGCDLPVVS